MKTKTFSLPPPPLAAARNHVNRMCLAADIPLIESGTAGYLGQVTVIKKVGARPASRMRKQLFSVAAAHTINSKPVPVCSGRKGWFFSFF